MRCDVSAEAQIDINLLCDLQDEYARVFQSALRVTHDEVPLGSHIGTVISWGVPCNVKVPETWIVESPDLAKVPW